jgi:hypothetical protein
LSAFDPADWKVEIQGKQLMMIVEVQFAAQSCLAELILVQYTEIVKLKRFFVPLNLPGERNGNCCWSWLLWRED